MIIHFHVEANTIGELKEKLREALGEDEAHVAPHLLVQAHTALAAAQMDQLVKNLTTKTSGSTEKEPQQEELQMPKDEPEPQPEAEKTYDLVAVRAAANDYKDKHGIEKLREIFKKHGGEKLKDIPEKNYAALMKEIA